MLRDEVWRLIEYGVKQTEIAKRAGVSPMTITNYIYNDSYNYSKAAEEKIAAAVQEIKNGIAGIDSDK